MAYTIENNYTGNGSTRIYSFTFPYLEDTDIKVSLNQVDTTNFELANATQINFTADAGGATSTQEASGAPKSSVAIRVYRDTNIDNLQSEFFSGSAVRAQDLNNDFNQTLYVCQETEKSVDGKWNDSTQTLDSTEAFVDSDSYIMTAKAIDDRINTNIASHSLTDGKIWAGNSSNVSAQVTPSGDVTMSNAGAFTIANGAVEHAMLANDSIDGDNIQDDAINSEHITDGSVDLAHLSANSVNSSKIVDGSIVNADLNSSADIAHSKLASVTSGQILVGNGSNVPTAVAVSGDVTLANDGAVTIANDAVEQAMIADDAVGADQLASNAVVNASVASGAAIAHSKLANVSDGQILVGNGSNVPTAVAVSGDVTIANTGAVTIANDAIEIGMIGCEQTTISDSDSHIPTSGAVVDYVSSVIAPIGGLEVIADDESFPNTIPAAGIVISITDAAGLQVNSSGVSTNADTLDNSTVTINGFPSELRGGVGSNADPYVFQSGAGLMVVSTGSSQTYNYHQAMIRESDFVQLSDDINDFNNRYRVAAGEPGSDNDEGDLVFDTNANKMKVYDGSSWGEVTSTGDFKYLVLCNAGTTDAATYGSAQSYDLKETSTSGSAASVTSAAQLIVSVNGVIQKPNTGTSAPAEGFAMSDADTIIFSAAPAASSSVFVIQVGSAVSIPTPGDGTVTAAKIGAGAVIAAKIGTGAVEHAKLAADCVDGDNLADNAVDSEHYTDGSIDNAHLADNAVDLAEMAHGTQGDVLYYGSGGAPTRLGAGTNGYFLKTQGGSANPVWAEVSAGVTSDGQYNTVAGTNAGDSFNGTNATDNTLYGFDAGTAITDGDDNTFIGYQAGAATTESSLHVAVGHRAFASHNQNAAAGRTGNVAIGTQCMEESTSSYNTTAVGTEAMENAIDGYQNVMIGYRAGYDGFQSGEGNNNIGIGTSCFNSATSALSNIGIGTQSLEDLTTGDYNNCIGFQSGMQLTEGAANTALGYYCLSQCTTGDYNIAVGSSAMSVGITTGDENVCIGRNAGDDMAGGYENVCVGARAGRDITSGFRNVFVGTDTGIVHTDGHYAAALGHKALHQVTGNSDVGIGDHAGFDITSGGNNICVGGSAGRSGSPSGAISTGSNVICLGNNSITDIYCADTSISSSDQRDKTDITEFNHGLDWINKLKPVTYRWDKRNWYHEYDDDGNVTKEGTPDGSKKKARLHLGFKAQDVLEVEKSFGYAGKKDDMLTVNLNEDESAYGMKYERLVPILVNAIQELSEKNKELEERLGKLEVS